MKIDKSKEINGVYYLSQKIPQDLAGNRCVTYSWSALMDANISDIFKVIYRKKLKIENEFHGFFYSPKHTFILRCLQGAAKVFMVDLRKPAELVLNSYVTEITVQLGNQIYLPAEVAWGVMGNESDTFLQLQTTDEIGFHNVIIIDPLDKRIEFTCGSIEFSIADCYQSFNRSDIDEICKTGLNKSTAI